MSYDCHKPAEYWARVRVKAKELNSDGCSGPTQLFQDCCFEHDIAYRTGETVDHERKSQHEADDDLRECVQCFSLFRWLSPVSWARWVAVRLFGWTSYKGKRNGNGL